MEQTNENTTYGTLEACLEAIEAAVTISDKAHDILDLSTQFLRGDSANHWLSDTERMEIIGGSEVALNATLNQLSNHFTVVSQLLKASLEANKAMRKTYECIMCSPAAIVTDESIEEISARLEQQVLETEMLMTECVFSINSLTRIRG